MSNPNPRDGGIKNLVIENFEKAIFAVVLLLAVYLVYNAFKAETMSDERSPTALLQRVAKANEHVDGTELDDEEIKELFPKSEQDMLIETPPIESLPFFNNGMSRTVTEPRVPKIAKRDDPALFPVTNLELRTMSARIPLKDPRATAAGDKISALPYGRLRVNNVEKEEKKRKPKPKRRPISPYGEESYPEMEEMMPAITSTAKSARTVVPEALSRESVGVKLGSMQGVKMVNRTFVCVTGLLPLRDQITEYQKLRDPIGYNPEQDYPRYLKMEIERNDLDTPEEWVSRTRNVIALANANFAVTAPEVAQAKYVDPLLTLPTLPFVGTDIVENSLHSRIPERDWLAEAVKEVVAPTEVKPEFDPFAKQDPVKLEVPEPESVPEPDALDAAVAEAAKRGIFLNPDDAPSFKMVRFYDILNPGQRVQYRVRVLYMDVNLPAKLYDDNEAALNPKNESRRSRTMPAMESMPDESYYPEDSAPSGPLKKIAHGNPNINETMLSDKVRDRLRAWKTSDTRMRRNVDERYGLYTAWSEPSPPSEVVASKQDNFFVGQVVESAIERNIGKVKFLLGEPKVQMSLTNWDSAYNYDVPGFSEVFRGSILDINSIAKLIHPVSQTIHEIKGFETTNEKGEKEYEGYHFKSDAVVLSVDDGGRIPPENPKDEKIFRAPAELLIFDGKGKFLLRNELDDAYDFRRTALFEEKN